MEPSLCFIISCSIFCKLIDALYHADEAHAIHDLATPIAVWSIAC